MAMEGGGSEGVRGRGPSRGSDSVVESGDRGCRLSQGMGWGGV